MCRSTDQGGRRCLCDNSQARNHRRIAARVAGRNPLTLPSQDTAAPATATTGTDTTSTEAPVEAPAPVPTLADRVEAVRAIVADETLPAEEREQAVTALGAVLTDEADRLALSRGLDPDLQARRDEFFTKQAALVAQMEDLTAQIDAVIKDVIKARERSRAVGDADDLEYDRLRGIKNDLQEQRRPLYDDLNALRAENRDWSKAQLGVLADAYREVLGSVRPLGGEFTRVSGEGVDKKSLEILNGALADYPTEWIEESNSHETQVRVRATTGRAHYSGMAVQTKKKKVQSARLVEGDGDLARYNDASREYVPFTSLTEQEREDFGYGEKVSAGIEPERTWVRLHFDVYSPYKHRSRNGVPIGPGWRQEKVKDDWSAEADEDGMVTVWRRPTARMRPVSATTSAELTVSKRPSPVGHAGKCVAGHEFAHRMQHVRPTLGPLEEAHIRRRTTNADGSRHKTRAYNGKSGERVRPDGFAVDYMGKEYESKTYHELLSTGFEAVFTGTQGGLVGMDGYKNDPDSRNFILGVLAAG